MKEIDTILSEVIVRMNQNRTFEKHYSELQSICNSIIGNVKDLEALLTTDNFLLFIDLFKKDSIRMDVCKEILIAYKSNVPVPAYEQESIISDVVVMNSLLQISKHLNDGITYDHFLFFILINNFFKKSSIFYNKNNNKMFVFQSHDKRR